MRWSVTEEGESPMPMSAETKDRFEQEERAYWQQRPELLNRYAGQWVAIVGGQVVATGDSSGAVIREAYRKTGSRIGYVARVGHEDELYRIRRVTSGYHWACGTPPGAPSEWLEWARC